MPRSDTDRWPWSIFGRCHQSHGAGPSHYESGVDSRCAGGRDVRSVSWLGLSFGAGPDLVVVRHIPAGPPSAPSFAGSHNIFTIVPAITESGKERESSVAACQAFLGGTSGFFRAFRSEYSNVEAVKANGRSTNVYSAAFTV